MFLRGSYNNQIQLKLRFSILLHKLMQKRIEIKHLEWKWSLFIPTPYLPSVLAHGGRRGCRIVPAISVAPPQILIDVVAGTVPPTPRSSSVHPYRHCADHSLSFGCLPAAALHRAILRSALHAPHSAVSAVALISPLRLVHKTPTLTSNLDLTPLNLKSNHQIITCIERHPLDLQAFALPSTTCS